MKLTIVVPAYNEEKCITQCLKSLLAQNDTNFELIVINNNSTDDTDVLAKKYCKKVYMEKKKGYHNAVKAGVARATGDLLAICDADTIYPKNWTEEIYKVFKKNKGIVACYGSVKFYDGNKMTRKLSEKSFLLFMKFMRKRGINICCGFNFVFKKSAYQKVGGYDPKIYNQAGLDIQLGIRLTGVGKVLFWPALTAKTSLRRVEKQGMIKFLNSYFRMYRAFMKKRQVKETYDEYNIIKT